MHQTRCPPLPTGHGHGVVCHHVPPHKVTLAVGFCESISSAVCIGNGIRSSRSGRSNGSNESSGAVGAVWAIIHKQSSMSLLVEHFNTLH